MGRLIVFPPFLLFLYSSSFSSTFTSSFSFFLLKFCWEEFSVTTGQIVLIFGDIVDMGMKLYKRVSSGPLTDIGLHLAKACYPCSW